jgi:beta-mannosidase
MEKRITPEEYDKCDSLFVSEFGYVGACSKETVLTYLDGSKADRQSQVWQHHTNTFECDTVDAGIAKHYTDPGALTLDEYLLYSGLCQGLMYAYALDSMRYRPNCHGSLFWMFNDCWGEVGWTIVDYYLRRKPAWYFVRRAYAPLRLIVRRDGENLCVVCANGTPESHTFEIDYGYVSLDGARVEVQTVKADVPALERAQLCTFKPGDWDARQGLWIARAVGRTDIAPAIYRAVDFRQLETTDPGLSVQVVSSDGKQCVLGVTADGYAHAVHLELPEGAYPADDYFDLLPGEAREIAILSPEMLDPAAIRVNCVNARTR